MPDAPEPQGADRPATDPEPAVAPTRSGSAGSVETRGGWAPDEVLLDSVALAQRALLEVTAPETVGSVIGHVAEGEHVVSLHFAADLTGYPGWHWSVTLARVEGAEPTVLETELMPGERALLAPEWVPWSDRLAEYRAAQAAAVAEEDERDDDDGGEGAAATSGGFANAPDDVEDDLSDEADDADDDDLFDGIDIDALDDAEED